MKSRVKARNDLADWVAKWISFTTALKPPPAGPWRNEVTGSGSRIK